MTRPRRTPLVLSCCAAALALAACSGDGDGDSGSGADEGTVVCESGTVGSGRGPAETDVRITRYEATWRLARDGGGAVTDETITVDYDDDEHHGIFREFDDDQIQVVDVSGKVDGRPEAQVGPGTSGGPRLTLGSPEVTLEPGEHVFEIRFRANGVLEPATDVDQDWEFDQVVIDPAWTLDMEDVEVVVDLPADSSGDVRCTAGPGASASVEGVGTSTVVLHADQVPAGSGVRLIAGTDEDPYE